MTRIRERDSIMPKLRKSTHMAYIHYPNACYIQEWSWKKPKWRPTRQRPWSCFVKSPCDLKCRWLAEFKLFSCDGINGSVANILKTNTCLTSPYKCRADCHANVEIDTKNKSRSVTERLTDGDNWKYNLIICGERITRKIQFNNSSTK